GSSFKDSLVIVPSESSFSKALLSARYLRINSGLLLYHFLFIILLLSLLSFCHFKALSKLLFVFFYNILTSLTIRMMTRFTSFIFYEVSDRFSYLTFPAFKNIIFYRLLLFYHHLNLIYFLY